MAQSRPAKRGASLKAGGGQSSALQDHQIVKGFSPGIGYHLEQIFNDLATSDSKAASSGPPLTSYDQFQGWFQSPASSALAPPPNHDLSLPLCNYYISSSHNTYLSGNQFYGSATTEAYTNVLLRGCRCLEIDVWNGEDDASSVSSSDVEEAEQEKASAHRGKRAVSRLKSLRGKAREKLHKDSSLDQTEHDDKLDEITTKLSAQEIAERKAVLKTEPRVKHGYTLTKEVPFREVCHAIRDAAFEASSLPVIVSLEVHCNMEQQEIMVDIMEEAWKGYLVDATSQSYDSIHQLPSPEALRNKILIKVKWTSSVGSETNNPLEATQTHQSDGTNESSPSQKKKAAKILERLSKLGVYTRAYSFKSFSQPEAKIPTHIFSLDENKLGHLHSHPENGPGMFSHNRDFLVRIYPSGLRVNSSNIDPAFSWRQGAQIVALNWQKLDKGMMLNEGMFAGEEGYVLKPDGFRSTSVSGQAQPVRKWLNLTVQVIAGQMIPLPLDKGSSHAEHMRPYAKFQLHVDTHGPPGQGSTDHNDKTANLSSKYSSENREAQSSDDDKDEDERKLKRKTKSSKTSNPEFGYTDLTWTDVPDVVEELSFLRIKIMDDRLMARDELLAWACIRLDRLKTGYRFLHLLDIEGEPSEGVLLVYIDKKVR